MPLQNLMGITLFLSKTVEFPVLFKKNGLIMRSDHFFVSCEKKCLQFGKVDSIKPREQSGSGVLACLTTQRKIQIF